MVDYKAGKQYDIILDTPSVWKFSHMKECLKERGVLIGALPTPRDDHATNYFLWQKEIQSSFRPSDPGQNYAPRQAGPAR